MNANFLTTMLEASPYIVLGLFIAGLIRVWVPNDYLRKHLSGGGQKTLLKSVGIGACLPLCSCGTIPLGLGLHRSGAGKGNILAFMTSAPILSPVLLMLAYRLLGWKLAATILLSSLAGSYLIGLVGKRVLPDLRNRHKCGFDGCGFAARERRPISLAGRCIETLRWSFLDLGADVGVDIAIGLGLAAVIMTILPMEWISSWLGKQQLMTLVYVIALGIPVYACSIPSIPIVQGLLLLGATPGAAVAYLIAGPATNLGELNAIRKEMGWRSSLFYAIALILVALAAGMIADQLVFSDYSYYAYRDEGELIVEQCCVPLIFGETVGVSSAEAYIPPWHLPFAVILASTIFYGLLKKLKYFFINPCKECTWSGYGSDGTCGSKCHVRRKYEFLRRILRKKETLRPGGSQRN